MLERRRWPRVGVVVEILLSADSPPMTRRISDMSHGGLFIETVAPLPEGRAVEMRLRLPGQQGPMALHGEVVWTRPQVGMGIRFTRMMPHDKAAIDRFVGRHLGVGLAPA